MSVPGNRIAEGLAYTRSVVVCPRCAESNPEHARFCLNCGAPLAGVGSEERKLVTVLFCDLVGFTERSDRADPEDVHATLMAFHAPLKEVIELYGGEVDKFIGDAVMGIFGAPIAHEDDPIRAVLAALRIKDTIAGMNAQGVADGLEVRIGIDTGEAVVTLGPSGPRVGERVTGEVVTNAARLQASAPVDGIAVGDPTYRATRHLVGYEALAPGDEGKPIWRPVEALARTGIDPRGPATPFVGRIDESAQLRTIFRRVLQAVPEHETPDALRFVTIVGEPGIGKTRLITTFAEHVEELPDLVRWRQGRCLPYGEGVSFWALGEVLKAEAGILDDDDPDAAREKLDAALATTHAEEDERLWLRTRLEPLLGMGDPTQAFPREDLFAAWIRFLEALAHGGAFVLVFEDLHWADDAFLDFIERVVGEARHAPIMLVCATRPELFDRRPGWGRGIPLATQLVLPPLTDGETASLIAGLLDRVVLPSETQAMLIERSGGNPLYAEEFVRMLADRGILDHTTGGRVVVSDTAITVPETLQSLIEARLDVLPPALKALLHDAAVIGKVFWPGAVAHISGVPQDEVRALLDLAVRRELVRTSPSSGVRGQTEYVFWHALIRDVAYRQIPRAARGAKHLAVARWQLGLTGDRAADFAEEIAYHYGEMLDLAAASGTEPGADLRDEAASAFVLAGERARNLDADRAAAYLDKSFALMGERHPGRARASLRAAEIASVSGRFSDAEQLYLAAMVAFRATGDRQGLGEAMGLLSRHYSRTGDTGRSHDLMSEAVELLEAEPPGPELARVYNRKAGELLVSDSFAECLAWSDKALALSRELGLGGETVLALQNRGASRCELGDDEGLEDLEEAVRMGHELGLVEETVLAYGNLAYQLWSRQGPATALELWRKSDELATRRGFVARAQWARMGELETLFDLGEWDTVLEMCSEMEAWDRPQEGRSQVGVYASLFEAWVRLRRGEATSLVEQAEELVDDARRIEYPEYIAPALIILFEGLRLRGDTSGALGALDAFMDLTEGAPAYRRFLMPVVVRALVEMGRIDTAEAIIPDPSSAHTERHRLSLLTSRAAIDEANGDLEAATQAYTEAAERWAAYGFVLEEGLTRTGAARCLAAQGRSEEAVEVAREARIAFERLGARPALAEVDALTGALAQTS